MTKRNLFPTKEQSIFNIPLGPFSGGNGNDLHAPIGKLSTLAASNEDFSSPITLRELIQFQLNWSSVYQIVKATLWLTATSAIHVPGNAHTAKVSAQRLSAAFLEDGGGPETWDVLAATGWPGPGVTGAASSKAFAWVTRSLVGVDATAFLEAWGPDGTKRDASGTLIKAVKKRDGSNCDGVTNYGIRVSGTNEGNLNEWFEFWSRRAGTGLQPYIELEYTTNTPPGVPIITGDTRGQTGSPGQATSADSSTARVTWEVNAGPGKYAVSMQHQLYASSATDSSPGSALVDKTFDSAAGTTPRTGTNILTGLLPRHTYRERSRSKTTSGWGPWTSLADGLFATAYLPGPPAPTSWFIQRTTLDAPSIAFSIQSKDSGDSISAYEIQVTKSGVSGGAIPMWATGKVPTGTTTQRVSVHYAGDPIAPGDTLTFLVRIWNRDDVQGPFGSKTVTFTSVTGPTGMSPTDRTTKLLSTSGPLTIADTDFDQYNTNVYRDGVKIWGSGAVSVGPTTTTVDVTIPAGVANYGDLLTWEAQIRHTGGSSLEVMSPQYPIYIDTLPSTSLTIEEAITSPAGLLVSPTTNPTLDAPYNDPDVASYGLDATGKEITVRVANVVPGAGALVLQRTSVGGAIVANEAVGGSLSAESSYDLAVRYRDDATSLVSTTLAAGSSAGATNVKLTSVDGLVAGQSLTLDSATNVESRTILAVGTAGSGGTGVTVTEGYSFAHTSGHAAVVFVWGAATPWLTVLLSAPPAVAAASPANGATITDPTLDLVHTFSSPAVPKTQSRHTYRLYLHDATNGDQLLREVTTLDAGLTDTLPRLLLDNGLMYAWEVDAYDTDGLGGTTTRRTFTTAFTASSTVADLTATADNNASAIDLAWSGARSLDAGYHMDTGLSLDTLGADFDHFDIYWRDASGDWLRVDRGPANLDDGLPPLTDPFFVFLGGRQGDNDFRVTASTGAVSNGESNPALASASLSFIGTGEFGIWTAVPDPEVGDPVPLRVHGGVRTPEAIIEEFNPPGRGSPIRFNWGPSATRFAVTVRYNPKLHGDLATVLTDWMNAGTSFWFKPPAGFIFDPLRAVVVSCPQTIQDNGWVEIALGLGMSELGALST